MELIEYAWLTSWLVAGIAIAFGVLNVWADLQSIASPAASSVFTIAIIVVFATVAVPVWHVFVRPFGFLTAD